MQIQHQTSDLPENFYRSTFDNLSKVAMLPSYYRSEDQLGVMEGRITSLNEETQMAIVHVTSTVCVHIPFSEISYREVMTKEKLLGANYIGKHVQFVISRNTGTILIGSRRAHQLKMVEQIRDRVASGEGVCFNAVLRQVVDAGAFAECTAGLTGRIPYLSTAILGKEVGREYPVNSSVAVAVTNIQDNHYGGQQLITLEPLCEQQDLKYVTGRVIAIHSIYNLEIRYGVGAAARIDNPPSEYRYIGAVIPNVLILNRYNGIGLICPPDKTPNAVTALSLLDAQKKINPMRIHFLQRSRKYPIPDSKLQELILLRLCRMRVTTPGLLYAWLKREGYRYGKEEVYSALLYLHLRDILDARETLAVDARLKQLKIESYLPWADEMNCSISFTLKTVTHTLLYECVRSRITELPLEFATAIKADLREIDNIKVSLLYINELLQNSPEFRKELLQLPLVKMVRFSNLPKDTLLRLLLEEAFSIYEDWAELKFVRTPSLRRDQQIQIKSTLYGKLKSGESREVLIFITQGDVDAYVGRLATLSRKGKHGTTPRRILCRSGLNLQALEKYGTDKDTTNIF